VEINFIDLSITTVIFLFIVGFVGGMVSGFIGSGGAFVMTPAMMNLGVTAIVAVASNMCHKFPKALVGAIKRHKYGQVDLKLGIVMGISAEAGVLYGATLQETIREIFGKAGSNLYVSIVFVTVLAIVGGYVLRDAWRMYRATDQDAEQITPLARWVQSVEIPGTMIYFKSINARISFLFTLPLGFATGMLAATIAVGGFIGVPAMMYVLGVPGLIASATELVIAFIMGLGGSIKFAWSGLVDIRLAMIILAGSLFGIQLGAIGTTYVKPWMVKVVIGVIMLLALLSRAVVIPVYLDDLDKIEPLDPATYVMLQDLSFALLIFALATGAAIVLGALIKGMRDHRAKLKAINAEPERFTPAPLAASTVAGLPKRILLVAGGVEDHPAATAVAIELAQRHRAELYLYSVLAIPYYEAPFAEDLHAVEKRTVVARLQEIRRQAAAAGIRSEILLGHGEEVWREIVEQAEESAMDIIVIGRRSRRDRLTDLIGSTTTQIIANTQLPVVVVPANGQLGQGIIHLPIDGSSYSDMAIDSAVRLALAWSARVKLISVVSDSAAEPQAEARLQQAAAIFKAHGVAVSHQLARGSAATTIVAIAEEESSSLIMMGSHGRSGLERLWVGSITEEVMGATTRPVWVVRADATA
jgi:uncharacterized protein